MIRYSISRTSSLGRDITPPNASIMSTTSSVSSLSIDSSSSSHNKTYNVTRNHLSNAAGNETSNLPPTSNRYPVSPVLSINQYRANHPKPNTSNAHQNGDNAKKLTDHTGNKEQHASQSLPPHQQNSPHKNPSPDFYIIRVTYETDNVELDGIVLYKSIMLGNNERTPQVIKNSMLKLGLEGDPDKYTLAQVLPDKELVMPPNANVYYAVNTAYNLNFILRPKRITGI